MNDQNIIEILVEEGVAILTITRPKALNAINADVMSGLNNWFSKGYKDVPQLHGVIVKGSGDKAFVAGADIKGFTGLTAEEGTMISKFGHDTYDLIENFHVPVIAAVNGFALGGGCELAMACHMRVATDTAKFGQPEVKLGLIPGYGGTQRLVQLIGKGKAMELMLTADMIDANEAKNLGLVNHVVSLEELLPTCMSILTKTSRMGPLAITKSIEAINAYFDKSKNGFEVEYNTFGELLTTDECSEGVTAFIEKRRAEFKR